ncbi:MAG TPA: PAS domain S-box protein [Ideonella sp.]|uniref:PAS domain S-box protein n=1 Tax=Ideonella sp. TaxID=1929293 RepID=UPI002E2FEBE4|nr:PAS domain S-box protein [Ideonella sp.]HEX5685866.1 PAS domain S-box protein [Ideonella sp.]
MQRDLPGHMLPAATPSPAQAMCRAVMGALNVPAFLHQGGMLLFANEALIRLVGYSEASLLAMTHADLASPEMVSQMAIYGMACLEEDPQPAATEMVLRTATGDDRFVELTARRIDLDGQPAVLSTCQDLSDIRHVQTSLLNMSQVLNQIMDSTPVATFVIDGEHRVTHWNRACEQLTGRDYWDMQGVVEKGQVFYATERPLLCDLIVDGVDMEVMKQLYHGRIQPSKAVEGAFEGENFFPNFGEGGRWLFFTSAPLRNAQGEVVGAIETLQDVSQRRAAEEELMRHRNQLELLVSERTAELNSTHRELAAFMENASVGIIASVGGKITRHNKKFAEMFATDAGSLIGLATQEFFCSAEDYAAFSDVAFPVLAEGKPLQHEMTLRRLDGKQLWVQMIAYVSRIDDPTAGTWWLVQDRSEVRRAQEALESNYERLKETNRMLEEAQNQLLQSEKMASIGQLAAGVAHEINNPVGFVNSNLNSLKNYIDGLLRLLTDYESHEAVLGDDARRQLQAIKQDVDLEYMREDVPVLLRESADGLTRVKRIVQDLKDFSRVDNADWQEADLNAGLESTLNVVNNEIKYKAEVRRNYGQLPPVRCLAAQLNQVFMNLIVNAAHAIEGTGVITLSSGHCGEWVWVEVSDTGSGMSPEVQKRIFEPFYTTKPVGKGTGLGLSLSFSIVQKHKGQLKVQSELGKGSAFRIWIPVSCDDALEAPPPPAEMVN